MTTSSHNLIQQAGRLISISRYDEAIPLLLQATGQEADWPTPWCLLAVAFLGQQNNQKALEAAVDAARRFPENEWPHRLRAIALRRLQKNKEALEASREAARLAPDQPETLQNLAYGLVAANKVKDAIPVIQELMRLSPDTAMTHRTVGYVAMADRHWGGAEYHLRRALALNPEDWESLNNLGVVLQNTGRRKEAIDLYHRASKTDPRAEISRSNLKNATRAYLGGSVFIIWVALQVVSRSMDSLRGTKLEVFALPALAIGFVAVIVTAIIVRKRRLAALHPEVVQYYKHASRDHAFGSLKNALFSIALIAGCMTSLFWTFILIGGQPGAPSGPALAGYLVTVAATVVLVGIALRKSYVEKRRRQGWED